MTRCSALALAILFAILVFHPLSAKKPDARLHIDFLDVGQGDSALVTMPDGITLLVDGGGRPSFHNRRQTSVDVELFDRDARSIGEAVVSEYLWWCGLDRVDYILATHADADHINGLNDVVRNFKVRTALVARRPPGDPGFAQFATSLRERRIPLNVIGAGDVLRFGDATLTVLWPVFSSNPNSPSGNNESLVLQLRFGDRKILITGDVEKDAESSILRMRADLRSDVVKVPHHGSRTSSTSAFVAATKPSIAVCSVGQHSAFGHPHSEVVERWRKNGAEVLTTGKSGTITVTTNGLDLNVSRYVVD